jgi:hypothetical protein
MNPAGARASASSDSTVLPTAPSGKGPRRARIWGVVLFALGIAVLATVLGLAGWPAIVAKPVRDRLVVPRPRPALRGPQLAFTYGWKVLIGRRPDRPVSFDAFAAYLAGDSVNYFTTVGGAAQGSAPVPEIGYRRPSRPSRCTGTPRLLVS